MSVGKTVEDIRQWLPGQHTVVYHFLTPYTLPAGQYYIEVAMLDPQGVPQINLANEGKQADGWYRISTVMMR